MHIPLVLNKNRMFTVNKWIYSTYSVWILESYNSETFSSYVHNDPLMYSILHMFPWKYVLIRIQWRMNLEISSVSRRLHDLNIPYILSSKNTEEIFKRSAVVETAFTFWVIEAHRNSNSLQARWKLRTNIQNILCLLQFDCEAVSIFRDV